MVRIGDYGVLERVDLQCLLREREREKNLLVGVAEPQAEEE